MSNTIRECFVSMGDGVELYTMVILPDDGGGRFPTIIQRSPYSSPNESPDFFKDWDLHGYAMVFQHCRGTGKSKGICVPYVNERSDGLDLLDWIRKQDFYNGELFLMGSSYLSSVHFSYIDTNPPDVKGAFLAVQDTNRYNILYRNGFFKTGLHGRWSITMYKRNMEVERNYCHEIWLTRPLAGITKSIFNETVPQYEEEYLHPDPADNFWQTPEGGSDYADACNKCSFPILLATSFYDLYLDGVFDMWKSLTPERRRSCALIVTPFEHAFNPPPRTEPSPLPDFENGRLSEVCPYFEYMWFDHCRKGTPLHFFEKGSITYYRLFDKKWLTTPELKNSPCPRKFYLAQDRTLQPSKPSDVGEITYTYNPYAPAPFAGGVCSLFGGMQVQDAPNSRYDIISFVSAPFTEETVCEGRMEAELHCRSTAPDTCFYLRLNLVRDGVALSLRDAIDSLCRLEKDYVIGSERIIKFTFPPHAFKLLPGDVLRLDVSSSCVPHYHTHTNRKGVQTLQTGADICRNTIITGLSSLTIFCACVATTR